MSALHDLTIRKFRDGLLNKEFSAYEITKAFFDYIEEKDKDIDAYLSLDKDGALREASSVDVLVAEGGQLGPLTGVPLAVKDVILIDGLPATAGSKILENYKAAYDATVIRRLKENRAVFLGKTNMDEFAMGSSTENSAFKVTKNPHDLTRVPGGSSGGSAAVVASHMALGALGSDTGGSIRQPASFCGVVGLKPTYGAVSRYGLIAMASSLDQIGPIAKNVEDAAILFQAITGQDLNDSTSVKTDYGNEFINPKLEDVKKLKVGLPKEYFGEGLNKEVQSAMSEVINSLKSLGLEIKEVSLPHTKYALSTYYIVMPAEVSTNLSRFEGIRYGTRGDSKKLIDLYFEDRGQGFGVEAKRRIILGTFVLSTGYYDAYYAKAQKVRRLITNDFEEAFKEVDVLLTPVAPTPAFKIGEKTSDPLQMYLSDIFSVTANLSGVPGISIPVKDREGKLPIGFQLMGRHFREADILGIGQVYEKL